MLKSKLRKKLLGIRKTNHNIINKISFSTFCKKFKKYDLKNKVIGGYYPVNYEIDDLELLNEFEKKQNIISLPVIGKNFSMDFYAWSFKNILNINKYGIPEPEKNKKVYPDILLVPILGFDKSLYRLGYGGGFYDRYIEILKKKKNSILVGLSYSFQKVDKVPINKNDKKLDLIITEKFVLK